MNVKLDIKTEMLKMNAQKKKKKRFRNKVVRLLKYVFLI